MSSRLGYFFASSATSFNVFGRVVVAEEEDIHGYLRRTLIAPTTTTTRLLPRIMLGIDSLARIYCLLSAALSVVVVTIEILIAVTFALVYVSTKLAVSHREENDRCIVRSITVIGVG